MFTYRFTGSWVHPGEYASSGECRAYMFTSVHIDIISFYNVVLLPTEYNKFNCCNPKLYIKSRVENDQQQTIARQICYSFKSDF